MANPLLAVNYVAEAAISINRLVKQGASDRAVLTAAAATDSIIGVVNEVAPAIGERVDVVRVGIAWVEAGAAITRGSPITSDAVGRAVVAAPAADVNNRIIGFADEAASAAGDVIRFMIAPGFMQG
ncbi:MAG: capsid cement protein [Pseudomonadota bacterium]